MADRDPAGRDILNDLAQIATGLGVLAIAAIGTMAARKRAAKPDLRPGSRSLNDILRQRPTPRRKPPESGLGEPAVPPRGPLPMQGGAAAPLNYEA